MAWFSRKAKLIAPPQKHNVSKVTASYMIKGSQIVYTMEFVDKVKDDCWLGPFGPEHSLHIDSALDQALVWLQSPDPFIRVENNEYIPRSNITSVILERKE
jgi:hypothetical protein